MTLAAIKLNGHGSSNTARHECLPKKSKVMQDYSYRSQNIATSWRNSVIKVNGRMYSNARLGFSFTCSKNFELKQFYTIIKIKALK